MQEPEREGDPRARLRHQRKDIVERGDNNGGGDDRLRETARQVDDVRGRQGEGDGMRDRECRDDAQDVDEGGSCGSDGLPAAVSPGEKETEEMATISR